MSASASARLETGGTTTFAASAAALDSARLDLERVLAAGGAVGGIDTIRGDLEANFLDFGQNSHRSVDLIWCARYFC